MSSDFFEDTNGHLWWADFDAITVMLRMWSQAKAYVDTFSVREHNGIQELNFDQGRFRIAREHNHQQEMARVSENIYSSPDTVVSQLVGRYQEIPRLEQQRRTQFQRVQSHNHQLISRRVTRAERTVTALQFTRDASAAIFMCCIPASGLGMGAAMLARLGGSVFQGIATYQDTGNAAAALATSVLSFKSSLMALPESAGRAAQIIFTIVNSGNVAVGNSAIRMMTVDRGSATTFTNVLTTELSTAGLGAVSGPLLGRVTDRLGGQVLPVLVNVAGDRATSALGGELADAIQPSGGQGSSITSAAGADTAVRLQREIENRRSATDEAAWQSTPFYRYLATGDPTVLLSQSQQYVMANLLRQGTGV